MGSRKQLVGMSWNPKRCLYLRDQGATDSDGSDMDTEMPAGSGAISGPSAEAEKLMRESGDSQLMSVDADMLPDIVESRPRGNRYSCYLFDYLLILCNSRKCDYSRWREWCFWILFAIY